MIELAEMVKKVVNPSAEVRAVGRHMGQGKQEAGGCPPTRLLCVRGWHTTPQEGVRVRVRLLVPASLQLAACLGCVAGGECLNPTLTLPVTPAACRTPFLTLPSPPLQQLMWMENTADDPSRRRPDITKAKTLLGWEPKVGRRGKGSAAAAAVAAVAAAAPAAAAPAAAAVAVAVRERGGCRDISWGVWHAW